MITRPCPPARDVGPPVTPCEPAPGVAPETPPASDRSTSENDPAAPLLPEVPARPAAPDRCVPTPVATPPLPGVDPAKRPPPPPPARRTPPGKVTTVSVAELPSVRSVAPAPGVPIVQLIDCPRARLTLCMMAAPPPPPEGVFPAEPDPPGPHARIMALHALGAEILPVPVVAILGNA